MTACLCDRGGWRRCRWRGRSRRFIFFQHPRILASAALAAVDDQTSFAERDAGEPARHDDDFLAVQNVGTKVDSPAFEAVFDEAGVLAQFDDGLGDVVAR